MNQPIDTTKLDPATLAKHLGNPEGEIGKAVTAGLNKTNASVYSIALQKLGAIDGDQILEIGFGNGREIPNVLSLTKDVAYFGLDISETMVSDATAFNSEAVREGRVTLAQGTSAAIPTDTGVFSKAFAQHNLFLAGPARRPARAAPSTQARRSTGARHELTKERDRTCVSAWLPTLRRVANNRIAHESRLH